MACPSAPYPGLIKGSPGHVFAFANVIAFPIFIAGCTLLFYVQRKSTVFLRKRSFNLLLVGALSTMIVYSSTAVYDYVGSETFPSGLLIFFVYASLPAVSLPLVFKIAGYYNTLAYNKLRNELQQKLREDSQHQTGTIVGADPLRGEASLSTLLAHFRVAFCGSRRREDLVRNAKFNRTYAMPVLWFFIMPAPNLIAYFVRLGMNPQWNVCTGCEIETVDAAILLVFSTAILILSVIANRNRSSRVSRRDTLQIVVECTRAWWWGGVFYSLGLILFLADPGAAYKQGLFNYRWLILLASGMLFYWQSLHQILIARRLKQQVLLGTNLDQSERLAEVLADKDLRMKLSLFLDIELSGEILRFLTAVDEYKAQYQREGAQDRAKEIFALFIVSGSPYEINISFKHRNELVRLISQGNFDIGVFDAAYSDVRTEFLKDNFARFVKKLENDRDHMALASASQSTHGQSGAQS